ncbi:MAG TPA: DUF58 domain-containing protein [Gammaproteobacteria bacterium]|nr:DUF58 domain-containing protein [Gammaproteobacteria bacterium]
MPVAITENSSGSSSRIAVSLADLIAQRRQAIKLCQGFNQNLVALQSGNYMSKFHGRGIDFEEVRLYQPGDDIRHMDWRVTARTDQPHTKIFREERERPVLLCVDKSHSMHFATRGCFKSVIAANTAAILAWSATQLGDRVGGLVFSESSHHEHEPKRGSHQLMPFLNFLTFNKETATSINPKPQASKLLLEQACLRMARLTKPGSLVFILSDFLNFNTTAVKHLAQVSRHSQVILLLIYDAIEYQTLPPGRYRIGDGNNTATIDAHKPRSLMGSQLLARVEDMIGYCKRHGWQGFPLSTEANLFPELKMKLATKPGMQAYSQFALQIRDRNAIQSPP